MAPCGRVLRVRWRGAFFVISGFVIPWSMHAAGYEPAMFGRFLAKRMARLYPPFFVAALLALSLNWLSSRLPGFSGQPPNYSVAALLANALYLADLCGVAWAMPVFWTLAIEVQYYVLAAAFYPALASKRPGPRWLALAVLLALPFAKPAWSAALVHNYFGLFGLGIATFQFRIGLWNRPTFLALIAAFTGATAWQIDPAEAIASAATALAITFAPAPRGFGVRPLLTLGTVSYSLYLMHGPIGGRVMNLALRMLPSGGVRSVGAVAVAVALSLAAAFVFYRWVEVPAQRWSSRIKYRRTPDATLAERETP